MKYDKYIFILAGLWSSMTGLRMITQFLINPSLVYLPPTPIGSGWLTWDWWFDWLPQVFLGSCLILIGFKLHFEKNKKIKETGFK
jgi:hypothetical protein